MLTIRDLLSSTKTAFTQSGIKTARRDAEEIISSVLNMRRLDLYLDIDRPLLNQEIEKIEKFTLRRNSREPLQYILGEVDFLNCKLNVNSHVLIPRPETELLANKIINTLGTQSLNGKVLIDLCCGSGCLGISIKKALPELDICLSDLSEDALKLASKNAESNNVPVNLYQGDLLAPFTNKKAHFIVCNPPYIAKHEINGLDPEVKDFEPHLALVGGNSGLEFYERLEKDLPNYLEPGGMVWLEIGQGQGKALFDLFSKKRWKKKQLELDLSGKERFFLLEIE